MLYNRNIVLQIIRTHFSEQVEAKVMECVADLEAYELEALFEDIVEYADLDLVDEMNVEDYTLDQDSQGCRVSGLLSVDALINGYIYFDKENMLIGSAKTNFDFVFGFDEYQDTFTGFSIESSLP